MGHLPRCCGRADTGPGVIYHGNITLGTSRKHSFGGSFGLIWASGGLSRQNQTDNGRNQSCVWQVGAGWKRPTGPEVMNHDNITQGRPKNSDLGYLGLWGTLGASRDQTRQTTVGIKVVYDPLGQVKRNQRNVGWQFVLPAASKFKSSKKK